MSVYAYIRVSTELQTHANQKYEIAKYCRSNNLKVSEWISESVSGTVGVEKRNLGILLERMEKANKQQGFYARLQCLFSVIAACCCVVLLILGFKFMPQIQILAERADVVLTNLETVTEELADVDLSGLEDVIEELARVDVDSVVTHIDELVSASHDGIENTMGKLNAINFETLNKTIEDLSAVVERLAKITKFLG